MCIFHADKSNPFWPQFSTYDVKIVCNLTNNVNVKYHVNLISEFVKISRE